MALTFLDPIIVNTAATFTFANVAVTANVTAGSLKTDNLLYANGQPFAFPTVPSGSNTQIQFNDAGSLGGNPNFTFSKASNTLSVSSIVASGVGLSNLPGANVSGQVANALIAGTVYTNAQPNITSVGTLTALTVTGNITSGNAALGNLATANFFSGSGNLLSNIQGSNVTGQVANALVAGTVYTNAQPNITSTGTLTALRVDGTLLLQQSQENFVSLTGATGIVTHNFSLSGTFYHTSIAGNFTANITNLPSTTGKVTVIALMLAQGSTPYICNGLNIAGAAQTIRWLGGTAPVGTGTRYETQLFTIFQTGASTYTVTGLLNSFA